MAPDCWNLRVDDLVVFEDGTVAVVTSPTSDGEWVPIRYVGAGPESWLIGEPDLAHIDEIFGVVSVHNN
ncbi:MAG: hypothetical protein KJ048_16455 [Dehalococcoidia bacterium]|nr:hypothetical protein [Dehalococcoidia bacterium]